MSTSKCSNSCFKTRRTSGQNSDDGILNYYASGYPNDVLSTMFLMKTNKIMCDVELIVGNDSILAHRLVLVAGSMYFKAMFTSGLQESGMKQITLHGVCPIILGQLLYFMYTGEIRIDQTNVCHLLSAATMLQMNFVIEACCTYLENQLDSINAIGIADFALQNGCMELHRKANIFIEKHFSQVCQEEEFLQMSGFRLISLLKRDGLNVCGEIEIYNALMKWITYDESNRVQQIPNFMSVVRYHLLPPKFVHNQLHNCDLINRIPQCREYLTRIFEELKGNRCHSVGRRVPTAPQVLYVAGGFMRQSLNKMECYLVQEKEWVSLSPLPIPRSGLGGTFINRLFYAIGGRLNYPNSNQDSSAVNCFDPLSNTWKSCAPLSFARSRVGIGVIDGMLYAVGGAYGKIYHDSVERYDPEEDKWYSAHSMAEKRYGVGVAVVNNFLYAIGGFDGYKRLKSVEKYDPVTNEWRFVANMTTARSGAGVAVLNSYIYVVGGYDGRDQLQSVERYNTEIYIWEKVSPISTPRSALSVTSLGGKLFALGGYDGTNIVDTMEIYDPDTNKWTVAPSMTCARSGHCTAVWSAPCLAHCEDPMKRVR